QKIEPLPHLADSWNWVHVQVSGDIALASAMGSAPGTVISRLLCPRRLDPETTYYTFLVPAFEIGRQAGLGQDVSGITKSDPAWTNGTAVPLTLPFYDQFQFHTRDPRALECQARPFHPRV